MHVPPARSHVLAALFFGVLGCAVSAACMNSLHLDPAGTGGTSASTGSAPSGCRSSPECAYPKPICDTAHHDCVECLTLSDCAGKAGTVCSKGACMCLPGDAGQALTYCAGDTPPGCVDVKSSPDNCGACGKACASGTCKKGVCAAEGTGGSGGMGGAGTGGADAGTGGADAGTGGAPPNCTATCDMALISGGTPCPNTQAATDYTNLLQCAGCIGALGTCGPNCAASLCVGMPLDGTCQMCLTSMCALDYAICSSM